MSISCVYFKIYFSNTLLLLFIGDGVFTWCSGLSQVILINGLTIIGYLMFNMWTGSPPSSTQLKSTTIPSTITSIGKGYFLLPDIKCTKYEILSILSEKCDHSYQKLFSTSMYYVFQKYLVDNHLANIGFICMISYRSLNNLIYCANVRNYIIIFPPLFPNPLLYLSIFIGSMAFFACSSLSNVVLTSGLLALFAGIFNVPLSSVTVPSTVITLAGKSVNFMIVIALL